MIAPGIEALGSVLKELEDIISMTEGLSVRRRRPPRSGKPLPTSEELEAALIPMLTERGFLHHERLKHPRDGSLTFEYDFWRPRDGVAMEVMGYRADDEVYKDLLKFHVHAETTVGVLWVPRYKWVSGKRTDTNYRASNKAVTFADTYMNVNSLVLLPYDWEATSDKAVWALRHIKS